MQTLLMETSYQISHHQNNVVTKRENREKKKSKERKIRRGKHNHTKSTVTKTPF
jgi:phage antirepressor YoqD-like protein